MATISLSASQLTQSPAQAIQQVTVGWDWIGIWPPKSMITAFEQGTQILQGPMWETLSYYFLFPTMALKEVGLPGFRQRP